MGAEKQLKELGIENYRLADSGLVYDEEITVDYDIGHDNWVSYLSERFNRECMEILEIGSRNVTGAVLRGYFSKAHYAGFDYYAGENVDVVGDAHELSAYFDHKFNLIFSSAVFEHLAIPWKVSTEIVKCKSWGESLLRHTIRIAVMKGHGIFFNLVRMP